ncbi:hypothetical protein BIFGAL_04382 [Bifidobacterium gallicum DSM 20093 = LMG 11596]|uniref:Uncharacterized protein n=1 Tax=Bifidobacterium gallicum DSM 20093 = LMG 11596 TaxID=561180 RepID=D1NWX6_9BIFI|nr:hypothetical protein BIFGAL_04382 [Bifidobacterium gallicum DSM 20093 = LMG 11596]
MRSLDRALHGIALAQTVLFDLSHRHVDVIGARQISRRADERIGVKHIHNASHGHHFIDALVTFGTLRAVVATVVAVVGVITLATTVHAVVAISAIVALVALVTITIIIAIAATTAVLALVAIIAIVALITVVATPALIIVVGVAATTIRGFTIGAFGFALACRQRRQNVVQFLFSVRFLILGSTFGTITVTIMATLHCHRAATALHTQTIVTAAFSMGVTFATQRIQHTQRVLCGFAGHFLNHGFTLGGAALAAYTARQHRMFVVVDQTGQLQRLTILISGRSASAARHTRLGWFTRLSGLSVRLGWSGLCSLGSLGVGALSRVGRGLSLAGTS